MHGKEREGKKTKLLSEKLDPQKQNITCKPNKFEAVPPRFS